MTYSDRPNKITSAVRTGGIGTDDRRRLTIFKLAPVDLNSRAHVFGHYSEDQTSILLSLEVVLSHPGIMIDLVPMYSYPIVTEQPTPKRPNPNDSPIQPPRDAEKPAQLAPYLIKGKMAQKTPHEPGYGVKTGLK